MSLLQGFFALIGVSTLITFINWRIGLYCLVLVGILQDPIRKMTPDVPSYLVLSTAPIWLAVVVNLFYCERGLWQRFRRDHPGLSTTIIVFLLSLIPPAALSATYGPGSWQLTLIGTFSYGSLICGWLVGFMFLNQPKQLYRLCAFYCILTSLMLIGTPLEYLGMYTDWDVLGSEVMGVKWIRYGGWGVVVDLISGFYRSPDIMGWHAAATAMLCTLLAAYSKGGIRYFWVALAAWAMVAAILCGRRKMVLMIPIFACVLIFIYWWAGQAAKASFNLIMLTIIIAGGYGLYNYIGADENIDAYYFDDPENITQRIETESVDSLSYTLRQTGVWGAGLGSAAKGLHHLNIYRPKTWQEGGLSRLLVELGLPGLIAFFAMALAMLVAILRLVSNRSKMWLLEYQFAIGFCALAIANSASFVISHQVFGDPFIACWFSVLTGIALSASRITLAPPQPTTTTQPATATDYFATKPPLTPSSE